MTLLFWGPTLVEEFFGTQANWPPLVGGDDRGVDDTNIFAQTPITPKILFYFGFEPAPLSLSIQEHPYLLFMKLANHPPLLRPSPTKEKSFRPLLEFGGEERRGKKGTHP
jgi:hypothetical protein